MKRLLIVLLAISFIGVLGCKQSVPEPPADTITKDRCLLLTDYDGYYLDASEVSRNGEFDCFEINLASFNGAKCNVHKTAKYEWNTDTFGANDSGHTPKWKTQISEQDNKEYGTSFKAFYTPEDNFNIKFLIPGTSYPINGKIIRIEFGFCTCSCGVDHWVINYVTDIPSSDTTVWSSWCICTGLHEIDRNVFAFDKKQLGSSPNNNVIKIEK